MTYGQDLLMQPRVSTYTLGCKLNFAETSQLSSKLSEAGMMLVDFDEHADAVVINTCSVTDNADRKCRKLVRDALRVSPEAVVVIVGCYAQLKPEEILAIPGVQLVLGASEKFNLAAHLTKLFSDRTTSSKRALVANVSTARTFYPSASHEERTRSFLKVQDGCDYSCSFCTIPLARGASRSATITQVISEAEKLAAKGFAEVVLTGVNIGDFGLHHFAEGDAERAETFLQLIQALDEVEGISRFRISSIEPNLLTNEIIAFVAGSKRFVPHFHIPLQSGSPAVLKAMRRRYKRDVFASRLAKIYKLMPDACVGVDVIVGFPGETDADFTETCRFLTELAPAYLHVFTYSERPNTHAITLPGAVPQSVRAERSKRLHILSDKLKRAFYTKNQNTTAEVLWEGGSDETGMAGFTANYIKCQRPFDAELTGRVQRVSLLSLGEDTVFHLADVELELIEELELLA